MVPVGRCICVLLPRQKSMMFSHNLLEMVFYFFVWDFFSSNCLYIRTKVLHRTVTRICTHVKYKYHKYNNKQFFTTCSWTFGSSFLNSVLRNNITKKYLGAKIWGENVHHSHTSFSKRRRPFLQGSLATLIMLPSNTDRYTDTSNNNYCIDRSSKKREPIWTLHLWPIYR